VTVYHENSMKILGGWPGTGGAASISFLKAVDDNTIDSYDGGSWVPGLMEPVTLSMIDAA